MIIYSVTTALDPIIEKEWVAFTKTIGIPSIMRTGRFKDFRFSKVQPMEGVDLSYNIQFTCDSLEVLESYYEVEAPQIQKDEANRFPGKYASFVTILEQISNG